MSLQEMSIPPVLANHICNAEVGISLDFLDVVCGCRMSTGLMQAVGYVRWAIHSAWDGKNWAWVSAIGLAATVGKKPTPPAASRADAQLRSRLSMN
jgi:hypothetical protein